MSKVTFGNGVKFEANGYEIEISPSDISMLWGGSDGNWCIYRDVKIRPKANMTFSTSGNLDLVGTSKHVTGNIVFSFGITSKQTNGKADFRFENLAPGEWYRLKFDNVIASTAGGIAHGQASNTGVLEFTDVEVPS